MEVELDRIAQHTDSEEAWQTLYRLLHTVAGSSGMFGYPELGNGARTLEQRIKPLLIDSQSESSALIADLHDFIAGITNNRYTAPSNTQKT